LPTLGFLDLKLTLNYGFLLRRQEMHDDLDRPLLILGKQLASLGDSVGVCTPTELALKLSCRIHLPLVEAGDFFGVILNFNFQFTCLFFMPTIVSVNW
jgi:hypothetical protein